jgi:putative glycosyltransferase
MPKISLVTSLYQAAQYVPELHRRGRAALLACVDDYEMVFVDDGSPDGAREAVLALIADDPNVRLVELSRNFGQHRALMTGLKYATGDFVFMIDADLEEDPELLIEFWGRMQEAGSDVDVVYGVMKERKGGFSERSFGALFYAAINRVSSVEIPRDILGARLMRREFVEELLAHRDVEPYIGGLMASTGFRQVAVPCDKSSRGSSSYTLRRKLKLASDALFGFSTAPLTAVAIAGAVVTSLALFFGLVGLLVDGAPSLGAFTLWSIWFLAGLLLTGMGIVGMYTGRVLAQARQRPVAIVKRVYGAPLD